LLNKIKTWPPPCISALRTKPSAEEFGAPAAKKAKKGKRDDNEKKFIQSKSSVLTGDIDAATERLYKPKTPETKQTYEVLLSFIQVGFSFIEAGRAQFFGLGLGSGFKLCARAFFGLYKNSLNKFGLSPY
jgi:hypothetical protein